MPINLTNLKLYLDFVSERHAVWDRRYHGAAAGWESTDPIIARNKFTNVFRVLDWGSQFLLRELLNDPAATREDVLMRCFLYRHTNRPEPWEYFRAVNGDYPSERDVLYGDVKKTWSHYRDQGNPVLGSAYYITAGAENPGVRTVDWVVDKTHDFMAGTLHDHGAFFHSGWADRLEMLKRYPRVNDFLAQQILTDFHYSRYGGDHENDDVVSGPGSRRGAAWLGGKNVKSTVSYLQGIWPSEPNPPLLTLPDGTERPLSLMDLQNTLCEFDKYMRYRGRPPRKAMFKPKHDYRTHDVVTPDHWMKGTRP